MTWDDVVFAGKRYGESEAAVMGEILAYSPGVELWDLAGGFWALRLERDGRELFISPTWDDTYYSGTTRDSEEWSWAWSSGENFSGEDRKDEPEQFGVMPFAVTITDTNPGMIKDIISHTFLLLEDGFGGAA